MLAVNHGVYATPRCKLHTNLFTLGEGSQVCFVWGFGLGFFFFFLSNNSLCRMAAVSAFILKLVDMSSDWSHLLTSVIATVFYIPVQNGF